MPDLERGDAGTRPDIRGGLPAGTALHGYELKSILGKGAFGITYRARDVTLNRDVAIKEYLPATLALREGRTTVLPVSTDHAEPFAWGRERFLDEARTLAQLDRTPAIVRVHDFFEDNGTAYMVMALIEGETLNKRLLREQRLTPEAVDRLVFPLLDGLEEVHGIGFLHRDIKPANIMIDGRGRPTLIDFGASRAAMVGRSTTMTAIFTPGYAAAEQYTSATLGPWTDIYGLAATLYHAITGRIPPSSIDRIIKDTYEPLSELRPEGYALELLAGIDAGMERHVGDRPQSIADWRHVLRTGERQASAQEATQVEHKPRRLSVIPGRSRNAGITLRGPALWGAAAAAAILLAGGSWLAFTANRPLPTAMATLDLSTEQLEQVLAERRKADALAAEKRRLEEEARQKVDVEAEAKRQAESELKQARQARQRAEQELAELKARIAAGTGQSGQSDQAAVATRRGAEEAAQRKAEADAAALRQAEEEANKKLEADAEAKRRADEALAKAEAERQRAEQEARAKAEAEQAALRQASEEAQRKAADAESVKQAEVARAKAEAERQKAEAERQKAEAEAKARADAEMAEKALRLDQQGRERLQLALTSLGFDTRGTDGILGPRSREMISAWQKARNQPVTGFLNAAQQEVLLKEAASALSKHDEQKKAEEEAKTRIAATAGAPEGQRTADLPPAPSQSTGSAYDGTYSGDARLAGGFDPGTGKSVVFRLQLVDGRGTGSIDAPSCNASRFSASVSPSGALFGEGYLDCMVGGHTGPFKIDGNATKGAFRIALTFERGSVLRTRLTSVDVPSASASQALAASAVQPSSTAYDGSYSGDLRVTQGRAAVLLRVTNGRGTGTLAAPGCNPSRFSLTIQPAGKVSGEGDFNCFVGHPSGTNFSGPFKVDGTHEDKSLRLSFYSRGWAIATVLRPGAAASPGLPSSDGLWRGTYTCEHAGGVAQSPVTLEMRMSNGLGSWKRSSWASYDVLDIQVLTISSDVRVAISYVPNAGHIRSGSGRRTQMSGKYDGNTIQAAGKDELWDRNCTLVLNRVGQ